MVYTIGLGPIARKSVQVQVLFPAQNLGRLPFRYTYSDTVSLYSGYF